MAQALFIVLPVIHHSSSRYDLLSHMGIFASIPKTKHPERRDTAPWRS